MLSSINEANYRMPAEWEKQKSTWIAWPHNKKDWPNKFEFIPGVFGEIVAQISKVQKINILIEKKKDKEKVKIVLKKLPINSKNIYFKICKTDRAWLRDSFPIFVKNKLKKNILIDWRFNAWAKYKNFKNDNKICVRIKKYTNYELVKPLANKKRIILEGGSIDVNGKGLLLTTRECLLSKKQERNPNFKRNDYENIFNKFLGINKVLWLQGGIAGDDTHGHIDDIARFISEKKIFIADEKNPKDVNYKILKKNFRIIKRLIKKENLNIIKIPMPKAKFIEGVRVPASYLNFYIANRLVLVPTFKDNNDKIVLKIFKRHFKKRKIVPIDCTKLIWGFGAVHCMTQQEPM